MKSRKKPILPYIMLTKIKMGVIKNLFVFAMVKIVNTFDVDDFIK